MKKPVLALCQDSVAISAENNATFCLIVVAAVDGEFVCKRLKLKPRMCLMPDNPEYPPIFINHGQELEIVGTVTAAINKF